jgi:hypothetical protein
MAAAAAGLQSVITCSSAAVALLAPAQRQLGAGAAHLAPDLLGRLAQEDLLVIRPDLREVVMREQHRPAALPADDRHAQDRGDGRVRKAPAHRLVAHPGAGGEIVDADRPPAPQVLVDAAALRAERIDAAHVVRAFARKAGGNGEQARILVHFGIADPRRVGLLGDEIEGGAQDLERIVQQPQPLGHAQHQRVAPGAEHELRALAHLGEDARDAAVLAGDGEQGIGPVAVVDLPGEVPHQQRIDHVHRLALGDDAVELRPEHVPDVLQHLARRPPQHAGMPPVAKERAPGVVVEEEVVGTPEHRRGSRRAQGNAERRAERLRPIVNGAERSGRPVVPADERTHLAAARQEGLQLRHAASSPFTTQLYRPDRRPRKALRRPAPRGGASPAGGSSRRATR